MTTVTETLLRPAGAPVVGAIGVYRLISDRGPVTEAYDVDGTRIEVSAVAADETGSTTVNLTPNAEIAPAGTRWERRVILNGRVESTRAVLLVPPGGPYALDEVVADVGPLVDPDYAAVLGAQIAACEAAIIALGGEVGGAAPVTSVNGALGPNVVLTAADVGAATAAALGALAGVVDGLAAALGELTARVATIEGAYVASADYDVIDEVTAAAYAALAPPVARTLYAIKG